MGEKLIAHMHQQIMHLEVANTTANKQNEWWIPRKRSKVKVINQCNTCKVFSTTPYVSATTAEIPNFQTEDGRPFETTRVFQQTGVTGQEDKTTKST